MQLPFCFFTDLPCLTLRCLTLLCSALPCLALPCALQFKVTVPEGGVKSGEEFEATIPDESEKPTEYSSTSHPNPNHNHNYNNDQDVAPTGRFKNELCSCCETCPCPFFMGCFCPGILAGQVFQRMKYNIVGMPSSDYKNTCLIMTILFAVAWGLAIILVATTGAGVVIWYAFYIYVIVALTLARNNFRKKYNIPGTTCGDSALDDCCCAYWCGCCTVLQMHRHTHNEHKYRYDITSKTGLPPEAPEIV